MVALHFEEGGWSLWRLAVPAHQAVFQLGKPYLFLSPSQPSPLGVRWHRRCHIALLSYSS